MSRLSREDADTLFRFLDSRYEVLGAVDLCLLLGISRSTWYFWKRRGGFIRCPTRARAVAFCSALHCRLTRVLSARRYIDRRRDVELKFSLASGALTSAKGTAAHLERRFLFELFEMLLEARFSGHYFCNEAAPQERNIVVSILKKNYEISVARLVGPGGGRQLLVKCPDDARAPEVARLHLDDRVYARVLAMLRNLRDKADETKAGWRTVDDATIRRINSIHK